MAVWNYYKGLKTEFTDFYTKMLVEPRSDIMKELDYSRQAIGKCSLTNNAYGAKVRVLSCTRAEKEVTDPIKSLSTTFNNETVPAYCYGKELGKILTPETTLTDNWFCCEEYSKNPTTNNNPLYDPNRY